MSQQPQGRDQVTVVVPRAALEDLRAAVAAVDAAAVPGRLGREDTLRVLQERWGIPPPDALEWARRVLTDSGSGQDAASTPS